MVVVFAISVHAPAGAIVLCHFTTVPECPESVSRPLLLPEQMLVAPDTVPPMLPEFTVTVAATEFTVPQLPL